MVEHPAYRWANEREFTPVEVDCTTAVALKVLDGKCKMPLLEKQAAMAVYEAVRNQQGVLFSEQTHQQIALAQQQASPQVVNETHRLRLYAESQIPKPVMKRYKAMLKQALRTMNLQEIIPDATASQF